MREANRKRWIWLALVIAFPLPRGASICFGAPQPLCGVYCLYCAAKLEAKPIELTALLDRRYVGSSQGSSVEELQLAASEHGLKLVPLANLTGSMLAASPYPVLLHVRGNNLSTGFDHFILYLWCKNGVARIIDPMAPTTQMPMGQLESIWDGVGLIASSGPIDVRQVEGGFWTRYGQLLMIGFVAFSLGLSMKSLPFFSRVGGSAGQVAGLVVVATLLGTGWHMAFAGGLLRNGDAIKAVRHDHAFSFLPRVSAGEVASRSGEGTVLVDARIKEDYDLGHIQNAVSVPVNGDSASLLHSMRGVSRNADIIIYCQSKGCPYSRVVATRLMAEGFSRISVFPGGWLEWQAEHGYVTPSN